MKYTLQWSRAALDSLAQLWLGFDSQQRRDLNNTLNEVELQLESDPAAQGESRDEDRRVMFAGQLVVTFRVIERSHSVLVIFARNMKSRPHQ